MFSCLYHDLCRFQALLSDDLQEWYRVPVVPFEHFSDDGEEVPHSLWLSTSQGPKERTPLGGARGRRRRKVVDVTEHDRRWHTELDEDFLDVVLEVTLPRAILSLPLLGRLHSAMIPVTYQYYLCSLLTLTDLQRPSP